MTRQLRQARAELRTAIARHDGVCECIDLLGQDFAEAVDVLQGLRAEWDATVKTLEREIDELQADK